MKSKIVLVCATLLMAGCGDPFYIAPQRPINGEAARIRIDDGLPIEVRPGIACYQVQKGLKPVRYAPSYSAPPTYKTIAGDTLTSRAIHLGMPVTTDTPTTTYSYNEYQVEANKPVEVEVGFSQSIGGFNNVPLLTTVCSTIHVAFVPAPGADYELRGAIVGSGSNKYCAAEVSQIVRHDDGTFAPVHIPLSPAPVCDSHN